MLSITDCHTNTWKFDVIKVTNILHAQLPFFHLQMCSVVLLFGDGRIQTIWAFSSWSEDLLEDEIFNSLGCFCPKTSIPWLCEQTIAIKEPCGAADELDSWRINCTCSDTKSYSQKIYFFTAVLSAMLWFRWRNMKYVNKYLM